MKKEEKQDKFNKLYPSFSDANLKTVVPWIYYAQSVEEVNKETVDYAVRFKTPTIGDFTGNQYLNYYLARYNIQGEYLGMQELKT